MGPATAVEIGAAVTAKIAPEILPAMRSFAGKILSNNLGDDVAQTAIRELPADMSAVFRSEYMSQKAALLANKPNIGAMADDAFDLKSFELFNRSPALEAVSQTTSTGRGMGLYKDMLGMTDGHFKGGRILDVGSGSWQQLAYESRMAGFPSHITSVDPRFGLSVSRDIADSGSSALMRTIGRLYPEKNTVAATADALPFADNTFDTTVALFSTSRYRQGPSQVMKDLNEMYRVTKPGGEVKIFPVWDVHTPMYREFTRNWKTTWKADAPSLRADFETGRPAGFVDSRLTIHK